MINKFLKIGVPTITASLLMLMGANSYIDFRNIEKKGGKIMESVHPLTIVYDIDKNGEADLTEERAYCSLMYQTKHSRKPTKEEKDWYLAKNTK